MTDGTGQRDHIYVIDLPGTSRWTDDYAVAFEVATGRRLDAVDFEDYEEQAEQQIKIYHWRGREYVVDLSEEFPLETCLNREYRCRHVAYGPPRRLPLECPECHPVATDSGLVQDRPAQKTLDEDTDVDPNKVLRILRNVDRVDDTARPLAVVTMEKYLFNANGTDDLDYGTVRNAMEQTDGRLCLRYEDYAGHGYLALLDGEIQRLMQTNRSDTYNGPYGSTTELVDDMLQDGEIRLVAREDTPFAEGGESA